jgi:hypothetical protein
MRNHSIQEGENRYLFYMTVIDPIITKVEEQQDFLVLKEIIPYERVQRLQNGKEKVEEVFRAFTQKKSINRAERPEEAMLLDALHRKQEAMRTSIYGGLWKISVPEIEVIVRVHKERDHYQEQWKNIQRYLSEAQSAVHQDTKYDLTEDKKKHLEWICDLITDPDIDFEHCHSLEEVNRRMLDKTVENERSFNKSRTLGQ